MNDEKTTSNGVAEYQELLRQNQRRFRAQWYPVYGAFVLLVILVVGANLGAGHRNAYERGMNEYQQGNYAAAVTDFREDVAYQPDHSLGHYYLAKALLNQGNVTAAQQEFGKAYRIEIEAGNPDPQFSKKCKTLADRPPSTLR